MKEVGQPAAEVAALRHAVPYLRLYRGRTFVVKVGGAALDDPVASRSLVEQVGVLHQLGVRAVLVHGGGPQSTALARELGVPVRIVGGRRVTDDGALRVAAMVLNGLLNTELLALCRAAGVPALGLSGVAAGLLRARRRPPVAVDGEPRPVDYGYVGDVEAVDPTPVERLLDAGLVPVVSPLSADAGGNLLNVNADAAAAALAVALRAEKLVLVTDVPGLLERPDDPGSLVSYLDLAGLERLRREGSVRDGMEPKVAAIEQALRGGVSRAHLVSYRVPDGVLAEVFTNEGAGTLVVSDLAALTPDEAAAAPGDS